MKQCPTCNRTYTEERQQFCPIDGTPLVILEPTIAAPTGAVLSSQTAPAAPQQIRRSLFSALYASGAKVKMKRQPFLVVLVARR